MLCENAVDAMNLTWNATKVIPMDTDLLTCCHVRFPLFYTENFSLEDICIAQFKITCFS